MWFLSPDLLLEQEVLLIVESVLSLFSKFLIKALIFMNFPFRAAFIVSYRFCYVLVIFYLRANKSSLPEDKSAEVKQ